MMQTLYPIIRRVRRPLVVVTEPEPDGRGPGAHGVTRPSMATREDTRPTSVEAGEDKKSDEKVPGKKKTR